jgi:pentatricopeptide repeat protein
VDCSVRVFREMRDLGCKPNVVTYNTIIKLYCENGRYKNAYELLDRMHDSGCVTDVITYNCIFRSLEKPREILRLFDRMIESGVQPRIYGHLCDASEKIWEMGAGFLRPVFIVWKNMEKLGCSPDESAYNALIDALVEKGMLDMARKYDEEMLAKGLSAKPRAELGQSEVSLDRDL